MFGFGSGKNPNNYFCSSHGNKRKNAYYYRIAAYTWNGDKTATTSDRSSLASATTFAKSTITVEAPTNVKVSAKSLSSARISWSDVTGASGYNVYRSLSPNGSYNYYTSTRNLFYSDFGLKPGTRYYYRVAAYRWIAPGKTVTSGTPSLGYTYTFP